MNEGYITWAERHGFADWVLAAIWIIIAVIGYQVVALIVFFAAFVLKDVASNGSVDATSGLDLLTQNFDILFIGNSAGQILFFALATLVFCRLQASRENRWAFLRFTNYKSTLLFTAFALLAIVCIQPFIWFLGWLNAFLPSPDMFDSMQLQQMNAIQNYIAGDSILILVLFNVAIVPAICEEILFRGYVFRSFQKSWGIIAAVIVSGFIFGIFHLQLTHVLPLATIGMLLAYITWISESLIPAIAAHFLNNAGSVLLVKLYPDSEFVNSTEAVMPPVWLVAVSVAITAYFLYYLYQNRVQIDPLFKAGQASLSVEN